MGIRVGKRAVVTQVVRFGTNSLACRHDIKQSVRAPG